MNEELKNTQLTPHSCPHCGKVNDASLGHGEPSSGSIMICFTCAGVGIYEIDDSGIRIRKPNTEDISSLLKMGAMEEIERMRSIIIEAKKEEDGK